MRLTLQSQRVSGALRSSASAYTRMRSFLESAGRWAQVGDAPRRRDRRLGALREGRACEVCEAINYFVAPLAAEHGPGACVRFKIVLCRLRPLERLRRGFIVSGSSLGRQLVLPC